jgi:hypothetical protein
MNKRDHKPTGPGERALVRLAARLDVPGAEGAT